MANLTPAPVGTPGAGVTCASNVPTSATLTPATGSGYAIGDTLLCFTCCRSATPTVATPAGWTSIANVTGTNGRIALFAKVATTAGADAAPSVAWSSLTSGNSGSPVSAICAAFSNLDDSNLAAIADVVGAVANGAASTATSAGGSAVTTVGDNDLVLALTTRLDDAFTTFTAPAGFTNVTAAYGSASGSDFAIGWAYQVKTPAGAVTAPNFGLTGASSFASSGVMVALKGAPVPKVSTLTEGFPDESFAGHPKWTTAGNFAPIETGGQLELRTPAAQVGNYSAITSKSQYDLTGSAVYIQAFIDPTNLSGTHEALLEFINPGGSVHLRLSQSGGNIQYGLASALTSPRAYSASTDAWWRISESGGTVTFAVSADGSSWNTLGTVTTPAWASGGYVVISSGHYAAEAAMENTHFDSLNLPPPVSLTRTAADTVTISDAAVDRIQRLLRPADDINPMSDSVSGLVQTYSDIILATAGLVSYWRLGESSGNALDSKGSNPGTTVAGGITRNVSGLLVNDANGAARGDGVVGTHIVVPTSASLDATTQATVEVWVRPLAITSAFGNVINRGTDQPWYIRHYTAGDARWEFNFIDAALARTSITSAGALADMAMIGKRQHLVMTYDAAGTMKAYINGVSAGVQSRTPNANLKSGGSVVLFDRSVNGGSGFNGIIDEAAFYNVALTAQQALDHYNAGVRGVKDLGRTAVDSWTVGDSVTGGKGVSRPAVDSVSLSDSAAGGTGRARTANDVNLLSDSANRAVTTARPVADTVALSDAAVRVLARAGVAADAWAASDSATRASARGRTVVDSWSVSDGVVLAPRINVAPTSLTFTFKL